MVSHTIWFVKFALKIWPGLESSTAGFKRTAAVMTSD